MSPIGAGRAIIIREAQKRCEASKETAAEYSVGRLTHKFAYLFEREIRYPRIRGFFSRAVVRFGDASIFGFIYVCTEYKLYRLLCGMDRRTDAGEFPSTRSIFIYSIGTVHLKCAIASQ